MADAMHVGFRTVDGVRVRCAERYEGDPFVESMRYARTYPNELPQLAERLPEIAGHSGGRSEPTSTHP